MNPTLEEILAQIANAVQSIREGTNIVYRRGLYGLNVSIEFMDNMWIIRDSMSDDNDFFCPEQTAQEIARAFSDRIAALPPYPTAHEIQREMQGSLGIKVSLNNSNNRVVWHLEGARQVYAEKRNDRWIVSDNLVNSLEERPVYRPHNPTALDIANAIVHRKSILPSYPTAHEIVGQLPTAGVDDIEYSLVNERVILHGALDNEKVWVEKVSNKWVVRCAEATVLEDPEKQDPAIIARYLVKAFKKIYVKKINNR